MSEQAKLMERLTRRQIHIQQFGGGQVKKALPILRELARDLRRRIQSGDATEFQMGRMLALEQDIQFIVREAVATLQVQLDLEDFATQEVHFTQRLMGAAVAVDLGEGLSPETIRAIVTRKQMRLVSGDTIKQLTIREAFDEFGGAVGRDAMRVVQAGVLEGRTQQQLAREVAGMVTTRSRRQAETVIRTATNHIGSAARDEVYAANSDILDGERFLSVLDSRVTITCLSLDQTQHPVGQGPKPPLHYGCRSIRVPIIKKQFRIAAQGERASMDGPQSNQLTYGGFLRRQSKEFQDGVLGEKRAELFRSGKIKVEQFTDSQGRVLSLRELGDKVDMDLA